MLFSISSHMLMGGMRRILNDYAPENNSVTKVTKLVQENLFAVLWGCCDDIFYGASFFKGNDVDKTDFK